MSKGIMIAMVFAFVLWCVVEAVKQYRFERDMQEMDALIRKQYNWMWSSHRRVRPLFYEQRIRDEVFGEDV